MTVGAHDDFTDEELALIPDREPGDEGGNEGEGGPAADQTQQTTEAPAPAAASPAPAEPGQPKPNTGDPRRALRAARASEKRLREQLEERDRQLAELRARLPADHPASGDDELSDEEIAQLEIDYPAMGKAARLAKRAAQAVQTTAAASAESPEFIPPTLPPELQEIVDDIPDLLDWQHNPDQTAFEAAKKADAFLLTLPEWKNKPERQAERLAEVVKLVKQRNVASASNGADRANPADVIRNLPTPKPNTLSDIGGSGGNPNTGQSNVERYAKMSDADIEADLLRGG